MSSYDYDVIIIGSGPGGEGAAMKLTKAGKKVAVVEIQNTDGVHKSVSAESIIIATGSRPYHPPDVDFSHARVLDSDTVLGLDHTPRSLTIYGAGVIGCEYASIFCNLDVKVNSIEYFAHTTFNYPTMAEAYRAAALNGLNRVYN